MKKPVSSFRSTLGRVRGLGSARAGTHHWYLQRLTALVLIPLWLYLAGGFFAYVVFGGYTEAVNWLHSPYVATGVVLFLAAGLHHAASGVQVVIEDYVQCEVSKVLSLLAVNLVAFAFAILGILATAKIYFGA